EKYDIVQHALKVLSSLALIFLLQFCTSAKLIIPPITEKPTSVYLHGKFVWHDLLTYDVEAAKNFYGELLGWQFSTRSSGLSDYTTILKNKIPIGGIVYVKEIEEKHFSSQWMSYLSVPDVDKAVEFFKAQGGSVIREPRDIERRGRMAVVRDPQGALLALLHSTTGDPLDHEPTNFKWLWEENLTTDVDAAVSFYEKLVDYDADKLEDPEVLGTKRRYFVLKKDGESRAGITRIPWEGVRPNWLAYIKVEDPKRLMGKVEKLGGKIYLPPSDDIRQGSVAFIADPTGAVLALQKWPIN
ncbi:MAG TPA: VOC family protein, partial [Calditrichaeota bacterium]|nr:VOC family protein [Calditrichota bacterium]